MTPTVRVLAAAPVAMTGAVALALGAVPAVAAEPDSRALTRAQQDRASAAFAKLAATSAPRPGYASGAAGVAVHTVRAGETITGIAIRHGLRTVDLLTWNGLSWSSIIHPGDELTLRAPSAAPAAPDGGGAHASGATHTVQAGDTLWAIAQHYGVSVRALSEANDLGAAAVIFPGQELTIPGAGDGGTGGGSDDSGSEDSGSGQPAAPAGDGTYTVEAGDTLWAIAAEHGLSVGELLDLNDLDDGAIIYPGQELVVERADPEPEPDRVPSIYDSPEYDLQAILNAPQAENATLIIGVGRDLGVPESGIAIALATAMVESSLRNLDWGDRDSVGLFQQRPSAGWGDAEDLLDRGVSTRAFFLGAADGSTRGLLDIPGWQAMGFGEAAQAVQISAFPDRYDRWRVAAYGWLAQHG
ncbi:LysM peptidoglycan-binding domain-containing protein [Microbacterium karelineae]|uniref:LysM peptidoglycan-binding domain-containing protein n=1 Tax=Microbacterium karelineae TaxID=2654283 RepID=UPI0012EA5926|nr:LysM peptidoglycan-binding domain-containing protein [Microbacterium karelineae]